MDKAGGMNHPADISHFLFKIVETLTISFDYRTSFKILDLMMITNYWMVFEEYSIWRKGSDLFNWNTCKFKKSKSYN